MNRNGGEGIRWVFDPHDLKAHVLADPRHARSETVVTVCGRELPAATPTFAVAPSLVACGICEPVSRFDLPVPVFPTPTHY